MLTKRKMTKKQEMERRDRQARSSKLIRDVAAALEMGTCYVSAMEIRAPGSYGFTDDAKVVRFSRRDADLLGPAFGALLDSLGRHIAERRA